MESLTIEETFYTILSNLKQDNLFEYFQNNQEELLKNCKPIKKIVEFYVTQALEEASQKATLLEDGKTTNISRYIIEADNHYYKETEIDISKDSILSAYPLDLIK